MERPFVWPGLCEKKSAAAYAKVLPVDVGMYVSPVFGLKDMGDQLCAPAPPGEIGMGSLP